eukprot:Anaeramoba_ignava/a92606_165.p1 GENE.a92606_165~~a92606_165.p1  ORF type:complete len:790 (+),score=193.34 a92606_165:50-2419(+)
MSPECVELIAPYIDAINIDLKSFRNKFYQELSGVRLAPVLKNIERFRNAGVWVEVTTLFIPDENDSEEEMRDIAKFLVKIDPNIPWHISAFYGAYKMKSRRSTPLSTLIKAYKIGKEEGLNFIYAGNVSSDKHTATYCPNCKATLIQRLGYNTRTEGIVKGCCSKCGTKIPGIWSDEYKNPLAEKPQNPEALAAVVYGKKGEKKVSERDPFFGSLFDQEHRILILFGTQTGTSEELSRRLYRTLTTHNIIGSAFDIKVRDMEDFDPGFLPSQTIVLVITSTHGEGEPPDNARVFVNYLISATSGLSSHILSQTRFAVFGLGSSIYGGRYQRAAITIDSCFQNLGAERIAPLGKGDEADNSIDKAFDTWTQSLIEQFCGKLGGFPTISQKNSIQKKQSSMFQIFFKDENNTNQMEVENNANISSIHNSRNPFSARVIFNTELLGEGREPGRSCRWIRLDVKDSGFQFQGGDLAGVLPENDPQLVKRLCSRGGFDFQRVFDVKPSTKKVPKPMSIGEYFSCYCDISGPVPPDVLSIIASVFCNGENDRQNLIKLSQDRQAYEEWMITHKRGIVDVFETFQSVQLPLEFFIENIQRLNPRYYSIASIQKDGEQYLDLAVQVVEKGVCSNFLQSKQKDSQVKIFVEKSPFKLSLEKPNILIAAGTGIAPFLGMMMQLELMPKNKRKALYLFFGCRTSKFDFIFQKEIQDFIEKGIITQAFFAFSRDQKEKVYVQHLLNQNSSLLNDVISNDGCVLVCGSKSMGNDVRKTVAQILGDKAYRKIQDEQRYLEESW